MVRILAVSTAYLTVAAALAYPAIVVWLGAQIEGYSHLRDHISELGVSGLPTAWLLSATLVTNAVFVIALAWAVRKTIAPDSAHIWAPRLLALFGVTLFVGGLFPCDEDCAPTSVAGFVHAVNALPSMVATIGAPFALSRRVAADNRTAELSWLFVLLGFLVIAALTGALTLAASHNLIGLAQRVVLALQLSFFITVAGAVIRANKGLREVV